jgi:hypothetical protein
MLNAFREEPTKIVGIYEFQKGIQEGIYSDAKGKAELIINGAIAKTYLVHINRKIISSAGSIVSFMGLLKEYGEENLKVAYYEKPPKLPDLKSYMEFRREQDEKRRKLKGK